MKKIVEAKKKTFFHNDKQNTDKAGGKRIKA